MANKGIVMLTMLISVVFLCVLSPASANNQSWLSFDDSNLTLPDIGVLESDADSVVVDIKVHGMQVEQKEVDGEIFRVLTIPIYDYTSEIGKLQLPATREAVGIPANAEVNVNVLNVSYSIRYLFRGNNECHGHET